MTHNPLPKPPNLEPCDPWARSFPESWKTAYWRRAGGTTAEGYECPGCKQRFSGPAGYDIMHSDHIRPYTTFDTSRTDPGPTVWENLQVLCGPCNLRKSRSESI